MENIIPPPTISAQLATSSPPQSTNSDGNLLAHNLKRLSLTTASAAALPPSPIGVQPEALGSPRSASPFSLDQHSRSQLRKTPSSSSLGRKDRSSTPTLHKRASMNSLQGFGGVTPPRSPAFRRTSSSLASPHGGMAPRSVLAAAPEESVQPLATAATVAHDFFLRELEAHHGENAAVGDYETVVILQDNCYGHRFSRPRTSRASLNTIVERPERIHACILGLAAAYVRLGGRHADGAIAPHPKKDVTLLSSVPFRIHKTNRTLSLTSPAATAIHGTKWMGELGTMCDTAETKLALNGKELARSATSSNGHNNTEQPKLHEGDLYLCSGSLNALEGALGGVCEGVDAVFAERGPKRAFVCIRPPGHHCSADYPSGFCWLNNVHVGIGHASLTHGITHAAIIDFDLHHGDGSQSITWAHNSRVASLPKNTPYSKKTAIGYFSLHDINSYPCEMGDEDKVRNASLCIENSHGQTIWNVHLQPWKTEVEFWELYEDRYKVLLSKARTFLRTHTNQIRSTPNHPQPKAAIFLSAGFDASEWESPGMQRHQVNVPTDFYARFSYDVVQLAEEEGLGVDGRVISILEGGYSDRALMSGVLSHLSGLATKGELAKEGKTRNGLGVEMGRRIGKLSPNSDSTQISEELPSTRIETFDPRWWALPHLEEAENLVNPSAPPAATRKPRTAAPPTYSSATQSYTAKIVASPQSRRSLSGSGNYLFSSPTSGPRPLSPPSPAVDWVTAAYELSKLLIPSDRQTRSCKPEELNAEASRARRDRQSAIGLPIDMPAPDGKRMQLRDRKSRVPKYPLEDDEKSASRSSRRKTMADVATLNQDLPAIPSIPSRSDLSKPVRQPRRRLSIASSVGSERTSELNIGFVDHISQQDPLIIKKTRGLSNPLTETSKVRAVNIPPVVPRVASDNSVPTKSQAALAPVPSAPTQDQIAASTNTDHRSKDVDHLTSGLKKMSIKLNVPSKQEQQAREAKAKPVPRGRPKAAASRMKNIPEAGKIKDSGEKAEFGTVSIPTKPTKEHTVITEAPAQRVDPLMRSTESALSLLPTSPKPPRLPPATQINAHNLPLYLKPLSENLQPHTSLSPSASPPPPSNIPTYGTPTPLQPALPTSAPPTPPPSETTPLLPTPAHNPSIETPKSTKTPPPQPIMQPPSSTPKHTNNNLPIFTATSPIRFGPPKAGINHVIKQVPLNATATAPGVLAQPPTPPLSHEHHDGLAFERTTPAGRVKARVIDG